ncbi:alpha/beta hydrolase [Bacteroidota bacterium]
MRTLIFVFFLSIVCPTQVFTQETSVKSEKRVYKTVNGNELKVDIFYSTITKQKMNNPAIAFFHGGGWVYGDPSEFYGACERYAAKGFVTFSFQYRLSINEDETYPHPDITPIESVKDARSAIRWLRENAESLKINPEKIVVGGQSGGGHLAWATALFDSINEKTDNMKISSTPDAILLYSSCYNTMEAWVDNLLGDRRDQIWSISPYHNLKSGLPPALAFHGNSDCMVLYYTVLFFMDKMRELGNPIELVTLEGRDHYLGEGNEKYSGYFDEEILERTDEFLESIGFMPKE